MNQNSGYFTLLQADKIKIAPNLALFLSLKEARCYKGID
jgi:hypothetical protein